MRYITIILLAVIGVAGCTTRNDVVPPTPTKNPPVVEEVSPIGDTSPVTPSRGVTPPVVNLPPVVVPPTPPILPPPPDDKNFYLPPSQYDGTFKGKVVEEVRSGINYIRVCGGKSMACVPRVGANPCRIIYNQDYIEYKSLLRRHELGHCAGWDRLHTGGVPTLLRKG